MNSPHIREGKVQLKNKFKLNVNSNYFFGWSKKVSEWQRHHEIGLAFNLNFNLLSGLSFSNEGR